MASLFAQYVKERENAEVLETDKGFAKYHLKPDHVYIEDIFVLPEFRKDGLAKEMANEIAKIAKEHGLSRMVGSVCLNAKGATASANVLLAYGMRLAGIEQESGMIYFVKELV